jgi:putative ABC transport system permease protein
MALGARQENVLRLFLGNGLRIVGLGMVIGICLALGVTRLISSLLFGISAIDPITFAGIPALLMLVGLTATYLPARRATRVDPMIALRHE